LRLGRDRVGRSRGQAGQKRQTGQAENARKERQAFEPLEVYEYRLAWINPW
jgi:hypothetical protein